MGILPLPPDKPGAEGNICNLVEHASLELFDRATDYGYDGDALDAVTATFRSKRSRTLK
jgi:hypothetical protein